MILRDITLKVCGMSDALKLTPSLLSMLDRIERHSGTLSYSPLRPAVAGSIKHRAGLAAHTKGQHRPGLA
jgi:hypothetical protein